jgi:hypothetical protein
MAFWGSKSSEGERETEQIGMKWTSCIQCPINVNRDRLLSVCHVRMMQKSMWRGLLFTHPFFIEELNFNIFGKASESNNYVKFMFYWKKVTLPKYNARKWIDLSWEHLVKRMFLECAKPWLPLHRENNMELGFLWKAASGSAILASMVIASTNATIHVYRGRVRAMRNLICWSWLPLPHLFFFSRVHVNLAYVGLWNATWGQVRLVKRPSYTTSEKVWGGEAGACSTGERKRSLGHNLRARRLHTCKYALAMHDRIVLEMCKLVNLQRDQNCSVLNYDGASTSHKTHVLVHFRGSPGFWGGLFTTLTLDLLIEQQVLCKRHTYPRKNISEKERAGGAYRNCRNMQD